MRNNVEVTQDYSYSVDGMTVTTTETKTYTLTFKQLKFAVTADKLFTFPVPRTHALDILCKLIRKNRYELFGTCEGYSIITNGYGQFKEVQFSHGNPVKAETIFRKLEQLT